MANTDIVVVLPGITGSTLTKNGEPVWARSAGAIISAIRTFGRSVKQLQVPDGIGDEHPDDGVQPVALIPNLHSIPGIWSPFDRYTRLLHRLDRMRRDGKIGKVLPFPYDWRLSNRYNGQRLSQVIEKALSRWRDSDPTRVDAQVVLVCHSMGGLVARWYIEKCGGADVTRKLITLGTPYRGAARTIDQLANGVRHGLGPLAIDLSDFARSLPSSYQLLPDYACVENAAALHRLDEIALPDLNTVMLNDSLRFHRELAEAERNRVASLDSTHAIVGTWQPTTTTVRLRHDGLEPLETINGENDYGDGTVPLVGAVGHGLQLDTNRISRITDNHGHLQSNAYVLDEVEAIITTKPVRRRAESAVPVRVKVPELVMVGEPIIVTVDIDVEDGQRTPSVQIELDDVENTSVSAVRRIPALQHRRFESTFVPQRPGAYQIRVTGTAPGSPIAPVVTTLIVWPPE